MNTAKLGKRRDQQMTDKRANFMPLLWKEESEKLVQIKPTEVEYEPKDQRSII